ncbi:MAG: chorismate synthase [Myxococcota bacterium]|jgi:chorismate synthase|nr:chorismate synthase [Myxococcota bacterium]
MLKLITAGESHGPALNLIIDGFPRGMRIDTEHLRNDLNQRQKGFGRSGRMKIESDECQILSGIRQGLTSGNPVSLIVHNNDYPKWENATSPDRKNNVDKTIELTRPRPGHVDLAAAQKFLTHDARDAVERASARSSLPYAIAGNLTRQLLNLFGIDIVGYVKSIGTVESTTEILELPLLRKAVENSSLRCPDEYCTEQMQEAIADARKNGNTLGGVIEIRTQNLCPGLGSFNQWEQKLDSQLAAAIVGIPGVKAVEFGKGFELAKNLGSKTHDEINYSKTEKAFMRASNHAGGIEGGLSNGEEIWIKAAMKPIPTLGQPLTSVDLTTHEPAKANTMRGDTCAVPACSLIAEARVSWTLANAFLRRFNGATITEIKDRYNTYLKRLKAL